MEEPFSPREQYLGKAPAHPFAQGSAQSVTHPVAQEAPQEEEGKEGKKAKPPFPRQHPQGEEEGVAAGDKEAKGKAHLKKEDKGRSEVGPHLRRDVPRASVGPIGFPKGGRPG